MKEEIQTKPLPIYVDGELSNEYDFVEPRTARIEAVMQGIGKAAASVRLEASMIKFDILHGTNYRAIRHALIEEKRRKQFETKIGLVAIKDE